MQFDFGQNWKEFSEKRLSPEKVTQARGHFRELMLGVDLVGRTFLDIGFGQGLSLLLAHQSGAQVTGVDINPKCAEVVTRNKAVVGVVEPIETVVGSILDTDCLAKLADRRFDVVHSWGVLHHTGKMYQAIDNACALVADNGHFVLAIYNRHWSSLPWRAIKWLYCVLPAFLQKFMIWFFYPVIMVAKFLATGKNPFSMTRGMDFYYNVIDWVGGYPYEYANISEMEKYLAGRGFRLKKAIPARVPTGCNEFVFERAGGGEQGPSTVSGTRL
jgi:2-polyprenyl-6-hydroxyphenyl methylase/3-demethylubiquinone-9 3-methyltransferase